MNPSTRLRAGADGCGLLSAASGFLLGAIAVSAAEKPLPAFPGAEGWGCDTPGGRGGKVMIVTNLNPDGPGSLQEACAVKGPRIVVFEVSGVISNMITIENSFITIAGQTAPGAGITIEGQLVTKEGISDVVIRHLRVRPLTVAESFAGPEGEKRASRQHACGLGNPYLLAEQRVFNMDTVRADPGEWHDAAQLNGVRRLVLDHFTASWASDEVISLSLPGALQSFVTDQQALDARTNH